MAYRRWLSRAAQPNPKSNWTSKVDQAAKIRDLVLIGAGICYAAGYLARAIHAWRHNLGVLPGLQLDYFVAGFLLLMPPVVLIVTIVVLWRLLKRVAAWSKRVEGRKKRIEAILTAAFFVGMVGVTVGDTTKWPNLKSTSTWVFSAGLFLLIAFSAAAGDDVDIVRNDRATTGKSTIVRAIRYAEVAVNKIQAVIIALNVAIISLVLVFAATITGPGVLEKIPQEFGGVAPKCAQLDLVSKELSTETYAALLPAGAGDAATNTVRRSNALDVFAQGDPWIVKLPTPKSATYRLGKETVRAVTWCE